MLEHGGQLIQAARRYNIPVNEWIDLSTGVNPRPWPAHKLIIDGWSRLPQDDDGLLPAAHRYYASTALLAVAGSQAAIQALPRLRSQPSRIAILEPSYAEHRLAWHNAGFTTTAVSAHHVDAAIAHHDVMVLVNPNNPSGELFSVEQCRYWHTQLQQRGGWLIIDEAFIDTTPEQSLITEVPQEGLIILRSLGKFFGLAGVRVGFVFAVPTLLAELAELLGPWPISGPSRFIAQQALLDQSWQAQTRAHLQQQAQRLRQLLSRQGLTPDGGCALFQWLTTPHANDIHQRLAQQGILTRLFQQPASLRFGLPDTEVQWQRLEQSLTALSEAQALRYGFHS